MPTVSVVLCVYNDEKYLPEAIESILGQNYKDFELICCDDKSTDGSLEVLRNYEKKYPQKIRVIANAVNQGQAFARNKCIELAKGQYIAIIDSDDMCAPEKLEKQVDFLNSNPAISYVGTGMTFFDENGTWATMVMKPFPQKTDFVPHAPFCLASCMFRREVIDEVGGYNEKSVYRSGEDYELVVSLLEKGYRGANIGELLYFFREGPDVYKKRTIKKRLNEAWKIANTVRRLELPAKYYVYVMRPLILALLPGKAYLKLHRDVLRKNNK